MLLHLLFHLSSIAAVISGQSSEAGYNQRGYEKESSGGRIGDYNSNSQDENSKFFDSGSRENSEKNKERKTPRRGTIDPEVADQLEGNGWLDVIPGSPGKDYPNYQKIPETSFTCDHKTSGGYYADVETRCQVFHVCSTGGQKSSFICPSGSIFNQKYFVCDWWYDFECDDATDLHSLNEKINRGGTGSGPSGPGRSIEQDFEYSLETQNLHEAEQLQNYGNYVSADGFDLSLAGTGEGGPGYARNGNNKGYESNLNDEDHSNKQNGENRGQDILRRKNFNGRKTSGESLKLDSSSGSSGDKREKKNQESSDSRDESPREFSSSFIKNRDQESTISSDTRVNGKHLRKQNSANRGNHGVNYHDGIRNSNDVPLRTDNFRTGNDGNYNRGGELQQSNEFNQNNNNNQREHSSPSETPNEQNNNDQSYPRRDTQKSYEQDNRNHNENENRNNFGERSTKNLPARRNYNQISKTTDNNYNQGSSGSSSSSSSASSSGFNNEEYSNIDLVRQEKGQDNEKEAANNQEFHSDRISAASHSSAGSNKNEYHLPFGNRAANARGRQRTSGGLPGGLGNGYSSLGRARELPGSDVITGESITSRAGGETTLYDKGDQGSLNPEDQISSGKRITSSAEVINPDDDKIGLDHQNQRLQKQRSDFRDDNFPQRIEYNSYQHRKYLIPNSPMGNEKSFGSNHRENIREGSSDQRGKNSGKSNSGNDYLVGIVPGTDDRGNGSSNSNQQRRFLPIM